MTIGMLGKTQSNNAYALYLQDGKNDWDYIMIPKDEWDDFCRQKDAPVTSDNMRHYLNMRLNPKGV